MRLKLGQFDVFLNVAGGLKFDERLGGGGRDSQFQLGLDFGQQDVFCGRSGPEWGDSARGAVGATHGRSVQAGHGSHARVRTRLTPQGP